MPSEERHSNSYQIPLIPGILQSIIAFLEPVLNVDITISREPYVAKNRIFLTAVAVL